jgi:hypothetical protein
MRIETVIKRQERARTQLRDLYSIACHFGPTSQELDAKARAIVYGAKFPRYLQEYLSGYWRALTDRAYESELVFGGYLDGRFYSTWRKREDYYEKHGIAPSEYADNGRVTQRGHYWRQSIDRGTPKPFFISAPKPDKSKAPYGMMCRDPSLCVGKGYCPRDPTCGD